MTDNPDLWEELAIPPRSKLGGILANRVKSYVLRCRSIQDMTRPA